MHVRWLPEGLAAHAAFGGAVDAAVLFKEHAAKAGIKIEVVREPNDGYWENVWMKKPWVMCYWSGRATADWMFSTAYAQDSPWEDRRPLLELEIGGRDG